MRHKKHIRLCKECHYFAYSERVSKDFYCALSKSIRLGVRRVCGSKTDKTINYDTDRT